MSWYPEISDLQKTTISVKNNSSSPKTFNLQGTMTGMPVVEGGNDLLSLQSTIPIGGSSRISILANGKIYSCSSGTNEGVYVTNATSGLFLYKLTMPSGTAPLALLLIGNDLYISCSKDFSTNIAAVSILDVLTDTFISTTSTQINVEPANMVLCGNIVVCSDSSSTFATLINTITNVFSYVNITDSTFNLTCNSSTNDCYFISISGPKIISLNILTLTVNSNITPYLYSPAGQILYSVSTNKLIATGGAGGMVDVFDPSTLIISTTIPISNSQKIIEYAGYIYIGGASLIYKLDISFNIVSVLTVGTTPKLMYISNGVLYIPCFSSSDIYVVSIDDFDLGISQNYACSMQPFSILYFNSKVFVTGFQTLDVFGSGNSVVFITDGGESIEAWSQQLSYQPMCIDHMIVDNGNSRSSLSYGLVYGSSNPSGDDTTSNISLLRYISAEQLANLVEFSGKDLPKCILDGFHYLQGTVSGGDTLIFTFWYRDLNALDTLKNDYHPAMNKYATLMYGKAIAQKLKTSPDELYEKRKEQLILSKVSERDQIVLVIRRKAK